LVFVGRGEGQLGPLYRLLPLRPGFNEHFVAARSHRTGQGNGREYVSGVAEGGDYAAQGAQPHMPPLSGPEPGLDMTISGTTQLGETFSRNETASAMSSVLIILSAGTCS